MYRVQGLRRCASLIWRLLHHSHAMVPLSPALRSNTLRHQGRTAHSSLLHPILADSLRCHRAIHGITRKTPQMCMPLLLLLAAHTSRTPRVPPRRTPHLFPHQTPSPIRILGSDLNFMGAQHCQRIPTSPTSWVFLAQVRALRTQGHPRFPHMAHPRPQTSRAPLTPHTTLRALHSKARVGLRRRPQAHLW